MGMEIEIGTREWEGSGIK